MLAEIFGMEWYKYTMRQNVWNMRYRRFEAGCSPNSGAESRVRMAI